MNMKNEYKSILDELFDDCITNTGSKSDNFKYDIIHGDCEFLINDGTKYDLIYLDPPFFTQKRHHMSDHNHDKIYFDDIWENAEQYNSWLRGVFEKCWQSLSNNGSIYSHNNFEINSMLYSNLPENIRKCYKTNISWQRSHPHNNIKNSWGNIVDSIMMFGKSDSYFKVQYNKLDETYEKNSFKNKDDKGFYALTPITGEKSRIGHIFEYKGYNPIYGWRKKIEDIRELDNKGLIHFGKNKPYGKKYIEDSKGSPIQNIWNDIFPITRTESNKREYPTQKPIKLLERIIISSCPEGGRILDPFAGSGTTLMAALSTKIPSYVKLIDKNEDAIEIIKNNL